MGQWESLLQRAVEAAGVELLSMQVREFEPQGLTAFCLLSESHLAVHTWPERDYVGIDLFTCGKNCQPEKAIDLLVSELAPRSHEVRNLIRGEQPLDKLALSRGSRE